MKISSLAEKTRPIENPWVITGSQIRAARALLGINATDLAAKCGVSYATIQRAEQSDDMPNMQTKNLLAIKASLESAGVVFFDGPYSGDGGPGVRLKG